jgi:hypothetical protein
MCRRGGTLPSPYLPAFRKQPISGHPNKSPRAARSSKFLSFPVESVRSLVESALRSEVAKKLGVGVQIQSFPSQNTVFPLFNFQRIKNKMAPTLHYLIKCCGGL